MWISALTVVLALGTAPAHAAKPIIPFAETAIFFEFNSTDRDLGIQIFFDAEGWRQVKVAGPGGKIFKVGNGGGLKQIGSTEVFTESAEPELCEEGAGMCDLDQAIAEFLSRFPEGTYVFTGKTIENGKLVGDAELSWSLPAAVGIVDAEGNFPAVVWTPGMGGEEVVRYEVVVEAVAEVDDDEEVFTQVTQVTSDVTSITSSPEFAALVDDLLMDGSLVELKVEIIAIGANGNKTITEEAIFEAEE
ncbi:MAG: hypothetical protein ABFS41_15605 [Myxococcota bacterium]